MQLCREKNCWLKDLEDVPAEELEYWLAFYELEDIERKKAESRAKAEGTLGRHR